MSRARLVITAIEVEGITQAEAARRYDLSRAWVSRLMARYRLEGEAAFEPRSRRPKTSPNATTPAVVDLVIGLRKQLAEQGLDAGAATIGWHLEHHHSISLSRATIHRILTAAGTIEPAPKKRPRSSYIRFAAEQPNECWQSDFTHYRLAEGAPGGGDAEVITWLDDHSRYALHVSAHPRITAMIVRDTFRETADQHGYPASVLTDNGMSTTRFAGGRGGRNALEHELRRLDIIQKNTRPNHPTTTGKVERFQQTMKKWLRAQPVQPTTISDLQALIEAFLVEYNQRRPHRSLAHQATPATAYQGRPKASPGTDRSTDDHYRVRHDRIDNQGTVTLRLAGKLRHIGIGRTHARTHVILLIDDLAVRVIHATTGELLRDLTIDPDKDYQPQKQQHPNPHP